MKAGEWAETVQGLAAKRGVTYEPIGGAEPEGRAADALPRRHQPDQGRARAASFWGASCDADEHEEGGLFSKTVLPRAILAKAHMPDLAAVVPIFNVESIEPGERVEQLASRRKVEFESIDFNSATWPPSRPTTTRSRCASCSAPASSTGRRRSATRSSSGSPTASSTSPGGSASCTAEEYGTALDHAAGLFKRLRNEMEESGVHTYQPGPWHAGLEPFPDAAA